MKQGLKDSQRAWPVNQSAGGIEELLVSGYKRGSQMYSRDYGGFANLAIDKV